MSRHGGENDVRETRASGLGRAKRVLSKTSADTAGSYFDQIYVAGKFIHLPYIIPNACHLYFLASKIVT